MDPAFSSLRQAAAFAVLLAACLATPLALHALKRPVRAEAWSSVPTNAGPIAYLQHEVFEETGDIDLLFLGSSLVWAGIDTPLVERALSRQLGRKATVLSLASNWRGEDLTYFLFRDLLAHRRVDMVVSSMAPTAADEEWAPHRCSAYWYTDDDAAVRAGLPLRNRLQLFAEQVLGGPRHLLTLLRPDRLERSRFGAIRGAGRFRLALPGQRFARLHLPAPSVPADDLIYSDRTRARFRFADVPLTAYQEHFVRLRAQVARAHGVRMAVVNIPLRPEPGTPLADVIDERLDPSILYGPGTPLVGVSPQVLFGGLDQATIDAHHYDLHLNLNGAERFTRTILPGLLAIYARRQ